MKDKSSTSSAPDKWRVQDDQRKGQQGPAGERRVDQHDGAPDRSQKQAGQDLRDHRENDSDGQ